jgi:hypothetical protein
MAMVISQEKIHQLLKSKGVEGVEGVASFRKKNNNIGCWATQQKKQEKQRDGLVVTALVIGVEASAAANRKSVGNALPLKAWGPE